MRKLKYLSALCKSFSFVYMMSQLVLIVTDRLHISIPALYRWRNAYIRNLIETLASSNSIVPRACSAKENADRRIWTMWYQGLESAPPLIHSCVASMQQRSIVTVLDEDTLTSWIDVAPSIQSKLGHAISYTHFSDYVRFSVLARHGGMWLDATVLCIGELPEESFQLPLYTFRQDAPPNPKTACSWWKGYIMGTDGSSGLFDFCKRLLETYWERYDVLVDYFLIDHLLSYALSLPEYKSYCKDIPMVDKNIYWLERHYMDTWTPKDAIKMPNFNKLSYKTMNISSVPHDSVWNHVIDAKYESAK